MARQGFQQVLDELTGEHARQLKGDWRKMTDKYLLEDAQLKPSVSLKMDDNWAEFALRYVVDYKIRRSLKDQISSRILKLIEESEGQIKLGAPPFELASIPPLDINLQKSE
jgi:hypothetical protein